MNEHTPHCRNWAVAWVNSISTRQMTSNRSLRNYAVLCIYLWRWLRRQTIVCARTFLYTRAFTLLSSLSIRFYEIQINLINIIFVCVCVVKKFIWVFEHEENCATLEQFLAKIVWRHYRLRNDQDLIKLRLTKGIQSKSCSAAMRFWFFVQFATFLVLFVDDVPSAPTVVLIQSMWARTACSVVVYPYDCLQWKWIRSQKRFEWYIGICNFLFQLSAHKFGACILMCAAFSACSLTHTESRTGWSGCHNSTCVRYVCVCPVSSNTWRHRHQIRIIYEFIFCIPFLSAFSFLFFVAVHSTWSVSRCVFSLSLSMNSCCFYCRCCISSGAFFTALSPALFIKYSCHIA